VTASEVLLQYQTRSRELQAGQAPLESRNLLMGVAVVIGLGLFVMLGAQAIRKEGSFLWPFLPATMVAAAARQFVKNRRARYRMWRLKKFYDRAIQRLDGTWPSGGIADDFSEEGHPYAADLNLFGEGSLFELLCIARTSIGQRGLAKYLLETPTLDESKSRQEAIGELRGNAILREKVATLGEFDFSEVKLGTFDDWLDSPSFTYPRLLPWLAIVTSVLFAGGLLAGYATHRWTDVLFPLEILIAGHAAIGLHYRSRVNRALEALRPLSNDTGVLREGLALIELEPFQSPKMRHLAEKIRNSSRAMRKLERLLGALHQKDKEWFFVPSRFLLIGTQVAMATEYWRRAHGESLRVWLRAWSEFEALNALAAYGFENPENVFPALLDGEACFEAEEMGHPLLPRDGCVVNNIGLNQQAPFYVISGSNMSGKSTLLRAIGLNAVLAFAGAPVRARSLKLSGLSIFASLSIVDSLLNGKSKFLSEVDRLRQAIESKIEHRHVLFLVDEIFSGTNSRDRRIAAEAVVRTLVERGGIGALSTHDLALTEFAEGLKGVNVHMGARDESNPLDFDYLLKPGVTQEANALAIARMAGVPV
jgi:hypothetical protein